MKKIIFLLVAAGLFLAVAGSVALADQTVCQGSYSNCNAACAAAGGSCFDRSCSWGGRCPTGSVSKWCTAQFGRSLCGDSGTSSAFCKCTDAVKTCAPKTCASLGKNCGSWSDGCGGTLNCGDCPSGQSCSNSGTCTSSAAGAPPPASICSPSSCKSLGKTSGSWSDGCGGTLNCGKTPICASDMKQCPDGTFVGRNPSDGCNYYSCPSPPTPGCAPKTCASLGKNCGSWSDGCGGTIICGKCAYPNVCSGDGICYTPCSPALTCSSGKNCGTESNGCGGTLNCGSCAGGKVCYGSPSGTCGDPRWVETGTDLGGCKALECQTPSGCNSDGTCAYSASSPGTACTGGKCYDRSCDISPPVTGISLNPALPDGINSWYVSQVKAAITCSDVGSGCQKITYTTDNEAHWYDALAGLTPFTYNLNLWDGTYYVKAYSTDKATLAGGTVQAPAFPIKIDTAAPSVSVTGAPSGWQRAAASAGVSCSDAGSGCNSAAYKLKKYSSNPGSCSNNYADYTDSQTAASHVWVCAAAKDNAGNTGFSTLAEFKIDPNEPVTTISLNMPPNGANGWYVSSPTAAISCADVGTGCASIEYTKTNANPYDYASSPPSPVSPYSTATSFADGTYRLKARSNDLAGQGAATPLYGISVDTAAPSVSVTGALAGWQTGSVSAGTSCSDATSGCDPSTIRFKKYSSSRACPSNYADYTDSQTAASHVWVCAAEKDRAGNLGISSTAVEFKIDNAPPQVNLYGVPFSPCTLNPVDSWIDCSAAASINSYPPEGCVDADSGCSPSSYGFIKYYTQPASCPSSKVSYSNKLMQLDNLTWVCAYAEDTVGNAGVSSPTKFMVNRTFVIEISARAYGEIDVPAGTEVKGYLCEPSQYYCNHDAKYLASGSGVVGDDKRFGITFVQEFVRGTRYKVGLQTEKGYVESEFIA